MMPRKFDLSAILTETELQAMQQVEKAQNAPVDPTATLALYHAVKRLAERIHHMGENQEEAAQAIMDHLKLQPSTVEYDHGLNVLRGVADDLFFDLTS